MAILGIDHVQLAMPHGGEDEARRFYLGVLGMRILRGFATTLRGTLAFAPAEGGGTEVELRFPEA